MYLFRHNEPIHQSTWSNDDGGEGLQAKISARIAVTGLYTLLIRDYSSSNPGTTDLWKDGSLYAADVPVAGAKVHCGGIKSNDALNFFTSHLTGDSRLFLQSYYSGNVIVGHNDDYSGSGDFSWSLASRVVGSFYRIRYALVSTYSSFNPTGTCDVYMGFTEYFPNLKADDAMQSAPASSDCNCISWAGGRTDLGRYCWPPDYLNPWHGATPLESFDNFFGNTKNGQFDLCRYPGAMNYVRGGANANNAVVALWANSWGYTHASITKSGNDHPHGYDWESKPGGLMRTFHPRHALKGPDYGEIVAYYRWDGTRCQTLLHTAPGEQPMPEMDVADFTDTHREQLQELLATIPESIAENFEQSYQIWKQTWDEPKMQIYSDPRMFARTAAYDDFIAFCQEQGQRVWPLLFSKYEQGDTLVINAIEDLTADEYAPLMEEIEEHTVSCAK